MLERRGKALAEDEGGGICPLSLAATERLDDGLDSTSDRRVILAQVQDAKSLHTAVATLSLSLLSASPGKSSRYTSSILRACSSASNRRASATAAVRRAAHAAPSARRSSRSADTVSVQARTSPTGQYDATAPPTSRSGLRSLATTGVPHAIASATGRPNPSRSEGCSTTAARRYTAANTGRSRNGRTVTWCCSPR